MLRMPYCVIWRDSAPSHFGEGRSAVVGEPHLPQPNHALRTPPAAGKHASNARFLCLNVAYLCRSVEFTMLRRQVNGTTVPLRLPMPDDPTPVPAESPMQRSLSLPDHVFADHVRRLIGMLYTWRMHF